MKTFTTVDGKYYVTRLSRWISVRTKYNPSKRNSLYDFSLDENGYHPYEKFFDPTNGTCLDYFRFKGKTYAILQFVLLGSFACGGKPYEFIDTDGKSHFVSGVDFSGDIYDPYYIEYDECCENVRIYAVEEVR